MELHSSLVSIFMVNFFFKHPVSFGQKREKEKFSVALRKSAGVPNV